MRAAHTLHNWVISALQSSCTITCTIEGGSADAMRTNESNSQKPGTTPAAKRPAAASTAAKPRKRTPKAPKAASAVRPDDDIIRVRAYEIYLQRGHHGDPMEDWLRAERELTAQSAN
jgi:hypothetical protein